MKFGALLLSVLSLSMFIAQANGQGTSLRERLLRLGGSIQRHLNSAGAKTSPNPANPPGVPMHSSPLRVQKSKASDPKGIPAVSETRGGSAKEKEYSVRS